MVTDNALKALETDGKPIRVGMIGAGATGRAIALQLGTPAPGIRLMAISNRTIDNGKRAFLEAGIEKWNIVESANEADDSIQGGVPVLTDDPNVLIACDCIDVILEVTGTVAFAANIVLDAFDSGKHVVLVNAELDSMLGPLLKVKADQAGVVVTNTDGDEPGVAMTLYRYLKNTGLRPVAAGNIKGMVDYYRTPETQKAFAEKYDQDPRKVTSFADATKLSMETTVIANATGFGVGRRGMYGPECKYVREMADLLPAEKMLSTGLVDYALGAAPHTGAFVIVYEDDPLKQAQLSYYKIGEGPFYVFYTPYHLPHIQIATTIGQAFIHNDATVAPLGGPVCDVVAVAKRDLKTGETLDGIGGFCTYGLNENSAAARQVQALPIGMSNNCVLKKDVSKDAVLTFNDVQLPQNLLIEKLWHEQINMWPLNTKV